MTRQPIPRRLLRRFFAALTAAVLAGCATSPYEEARSLLAQGRTEQGLARLEEAARDAPRNSKVRAMLVRERELAELRLNDQAAAAQAAGRMEQAEADYRRVLTVNAHNERAQAGLAAIVALRRRAAQLQQAEALAARRDLAGAEVLARTVLTEDPTNERARALLKRVADEAASRAPASPRLTAGTGKRVTLEFQDANLRQVFDMIARTSGINFAFDKDVRRDLKVTINVREASVEDAVNLILATNQLERKVVNETTLLIYPNTAAKAKEYQNLMVRSFYISNADVTKTLAMIKAVVKTRDAFIDEKLNLLVMRDTPEAVRLAEKLIAAQDLADPEVTLDVEVLEVGSSLLRQLGPQFPTVINFQDPATVPAAGGVASSVQRLNGPLSAFVAAPAVILNLKQQVGATNVLANPRIRVKNREKAKVHIGDRVPVVTTTATANVGVASSVSYLDTGLKLEVEPSIRILDDVDIKIGLEVSNIVKEVTLANGGLAYQVGTRNASTVLRLRDGETQVLAGLIQDEDRKTLSKVPGLGDLPVLGRLFGSDNTTRAKTEIVLLITPHIARNIVRPDSEVAEVFSGTELSVGAPPLLLRTAPPKPKSAPPGPTPAGPGPAARWSGPSRVQTGASFVLELKVAAEHRFAAGRVELAYDPAALAPAAGAGAEPGKLVVEMAAQSAGGPEVVRVSFRAISKDAGTTRVAVSTLALRDDAGQAVAAAVPDAYSVEIFR